MILELNRASLMAAVLLALPLGVGIAEVLPARTLEIRREPAVVVAPPDERLPSDSRGCRVTSSRPWACPTYRDGDDDEDDDGGPPDPSDDFSI